MSEGERSNRIGLSPPKHISASDNVSEFDCGNDALNHWLKRRALTNESRFSRTYVVLEGDRVVAFFCIATGAVQRADAPSKLRRNAPDAIPVTIIGRLAVDRQYAGKGLGKDLLSDALRRVAHLSKEIGFAAVMVHAKDSAARDFYFRCTEAFIEFPADSRTLYLPMETVIAAYGDIEQL